MAGATGRRRCPVKLA
jgi:hypothetical protein